MQQAHIVHIDKVYRDIRGVIELRNELEIEFKHDSMYGLACGWSGQTFNFACDEDVISYSNDLREWGVPHVIVDCVGRQLKVVDGGLDFVKQY